LAERETCKRGPKRSLECAENLFEMAVDEESRSGGSPVSVNARLERILDFDPGTAARGPVPRALFSSLTAVRNAVGSRDWSAVRNAGLQFLGLGTWVGQLAAAAGRGEQGRIATRFEYLHLLCQPNKRRL
jgi:hypothetical protein